MPRLCFAAGTLVLEGFEEESLPLALKLLTTVDDRIGSRRARAVDYAPIVLALRAAKMEFTDDAAHFSPLPGLQLHSTFSPRPHQKAAFAAWRAGHYRGIAALPTGSGKTFLAAMAIVHLRRPTLVLAPTIDLVQQWVTALEGFLQMEIGMLGGGEHKLLPITVSTYDSAVLQMEFIGGDYAFLIFDECHHLSGQAYQTAAAMSIAPYRLGLTATPECTDECRAILNDLAGPVVCQVHIDQLAGEVLSPYRVETLELQLEPDERARYEEARRIYTDFLKRHGVTFQAPNDWRRFLLLIAREPDGRAVFQAFMEQRRISRSGEAKMQAVWALLKKHCGERMIIFTADNTAAYEIGRRFILPVLTHHTKLSERKKMLENFRAGIWPVLVTSKVLNEGVDVPQVNVGVIVSGSGSIREHVQRLGRILRAAPGKEEAVMYELLNSNTAEVHVSRRRREHRAYQR